MQIFVVFGIALTAVLITLVMRQRRDRDELAARVAALGGRVVSAKRVRSKKDHPFPDTGRGWWAWRIDWEGPQGAQTSFALTTREGVQEWRDAGAKSE